MIATSVGSTIQTIVWYGTVRFERATGRDYRL
jgi:hypothetical protein